LPGDPDGILSSGLQICKTSAGLEHLPAGGFASGPGSDRIAGGEVIGGEPGGEGGAVGRRGEAGTAEGATDEEQGVAGLGEDAGGVGGRSVVFLEDDVAEGAAGEASGCPAEHGGFVAFGIDLDHPEALLGGKQVVEATGLDGEAAAIGLGHEGGGAGIGAEVGGFEEIGGAGGVAGGDGDGMDGGDGDFGIAPGLEVLEEGGVDARVGFEGPDLTGRAGLAGEEAGERADVGADIDGGFTGIQEAPADLARGEVEDTEMPEGMADGFLWIDVHGQAPGNLYTGGIREGTGASDTAPYLTGLIPVLGFEEGLDEIHERGSGKLGQAGRGFPTGRVRVECGEGSVKGGAAASSRASGTRARSSRPQTPRARARGKQSPADRTF